MPRARTIVLAFLVSLASFGLAVGLAYRWLLREVLLKAAGQTPTLRLVLRPRGDEGRAALWGIAFLPVFWGGVPTLLSPLLAIDVSEPLAVLLAWALLALLSLYLRFLLLRPSLLGLERNPECDERYGRILVWRRTMRIALFFGLPGLVLCSISLAMGLDHLPLGGFIALSIAPAVVAPWIAAEVSLHMNALPERGGDWEGPAWLTEGSLMRRWGRASGAAAMSSSPGDQDPAASTPVAETSRSTTPS